MICVTINTAITPKPPFAILFVRRFFLPPPCFQKTYQKCCPRLAARYCLFCLRRYSFWVPWYHTAFGVCTKCFCLVPCFLANGWIFIPNFLGGMWFCTQYQGFALLPSDCLFIPCCLGQNDGIESSFGGR